MTDYDVIIAGGGMVGASLAHALARGGLRVALVEPAAPNGLVQPSYDDRAIALGYGTRRILEWLGVWGALAPLAEPIAKVHVSERGLFGFTRLDAREEDVEALGYVVTARDLGRVLLAPFTRPDQGVRPHEIAVAGVDVLCPALVTEFAVDADCVSVAIRGASGSAEGCLRERSVTARLLVAADGGRSAIRERLGIPQRQHAYGYHAVTANVTPSLPHDGVAYERFTDSGPLALLPMADHRCGLVWTVRDADLASTLALDDRAFLAALQERFGFRLGRFSRVGRRSHYPLELRLAQTQVVDRVAIVGNAAHTVHPIAGQGFNLGIRDVAALAGTLADARRAGRDLGSLQVLRAYASSRARDHRAVALATDALARLFVNPLAPLRVARNLGMVALDALPPLKHRLARAAMGLSAQGGLR